MGRSRTPPYRIEYVAAYFRDRDHWEKIGMTPGGWDSKHYGKPTTANLERVIKSFELSSKPGGVNAHLGEMQVTRARIVRQKDGHIIAEYERPMFEVNGPKPRKGGALYGVGDNLFWGTYPVVVASVGKSRGQPARYLVRFDNGANGWADEDRLSRTQERIDAMASRVYGKEPGYGAAGYSVPAERNPSRRRVRQNPPLITFGNPGTRKVVAQLSKRVLELRYIHLANNLAYKHSFARGTCAELLADGSVRLYRMDGRPLFKDFPGRSK